MATLQVIEEKPAPPPKKYVLTMSEAEARAVRALTGAVGGAHAFRRACDGVYEALRSGGVTGLMDVSVVPDIYVKDAADRYVEGRE